MPGPVSDSYDPEFGTSGVASEVREAVQNVYDRLSRILREKKPMYILDLIRNKNDNSHSSLEVTINATLTNREWRLLRFACERAMDTLP